MKKIKLVKLLFCLLLIIVSVFGVTIANETMPTKTTDPCAPYNGHGCFYEWNPETTCCVLTNSGPGCILFICW